MGVKLCASVFKLVSRCEVWRSAAVLVPVFPRLATLAISPRPPANCTWALYFLVCPSLASYPRLWATAEEMINHDSEWIRISGNNYIPRAHQLPKLSSVRINLCCPFISWADQSRFTALIRCYLLTPGLIIIQGVNWEQYHTSPPGSVVRRKWYQNVWIEIKLSTYWVIFSLNVKGNAGS